MGVSLYNSDGQTRILSSGVTGEGTTASAGYFRYHSPLFLCFAITLASCQSIACERERSLSSVVTVKKLEFMSFINRKALARVFGGWNSKSWVLEFAQSLPHKGEVFACHMMVRAFHN